MSNTNLDEEIYRYRHDHKMSQAELAQQLGVSQATVASWEKGSCLPHGEKRESLLKLLSKKEDKEVEDPSILKQIIAYQTTIIELLKEKLKIVGGIE